MRTPGPGTVKGTLTPVAYASVVPNGASLCPETVIVASAVLLPPRPSVMVYKKESVAVCPVLR